MVTGVGFGYDNTWILVSDPWTTGAPDHNNVFENKIYDNLKVLSTPDAPLWVQYADMPVQVSKMVYISSVAPAENYKKENMPDLGQHCINWCWTASAANSFKWYAHHGYPKLLDDLGHAAKVDRGEYRVMERVFRDWLRMKFSRG